MRLLFEVTMDGDMIPHFDFDDEIFADIEAEMLDALNGSRVDLYLALGRLYPKIPKDSYKQFILDMNYRTAYKQLLESLKVLGHSFDLFKTTQSKGEDDV